MNGLVPHVQRQIGKFTHVFFFADEGLGGLGSYDPLVEGACDLAVTLAYLTVRFEYPLLEIPRDQRQRDIDQQYHESQGNVDGEHCDRTEDQNHRAPDKVKERPADSFGQAHCIAGQSGHQVSDWHPVKVRERKFLELFETHLAELVAYPDLNTSAQVQETVDRPDLQENKRGVSGDKDGQSFACACGNQYIYRISRHQRESDINNRSDGHPETQFNQFFMISRCICQDSFPQGKGKLLGIVLLLDR